MSNITDAIKFGIENGHKIIIHAKGKPAIIVAYAIAAGIVTVASAVAYTLVDKRKNHIRGTRRNKKRSKALVRGI